jgi:TPR repeat protein
VGEFHEHGWGGAEQSAELAREFYRRSGGKAETALIRLDEEDRNNAELKRLEAAADGGDADSQLQLGKTLEYGWMGAAVDKERAERLYRQAADTGYGQAQYQLGLFLLKESAKKFLQLAADQGNWDARCCVDRINSYF